MKEEIRVRQSTGYGLVKRNIMRAKDLSIEAKAIYSYLCSFAGTGTKAYPLVNTILEELNISKTRYYKYLNELQEKGIIIIEKIKTESGMMRNIYTLNEYEKEEGLPQNEDDPIPQNREHPIPQNKEHPIPQNKDEGIPQNEDEGIPQNEDIEYKQRILTKNIYINCSSEAEPHPKIKLIKEIIDYLNEKTNKSYTYKSNITKRLINARTEEGFTLEDFKTVIDKKTKDWNNPTMEKYLRPQTLFSTKFEAYLNEGVQDNGSHRSTKKNYHPNWNMGTIIE